MTKRKADDVFDPRVDAAWRATSREEPPRALDDAIRAAARRESGAGPRPADVPVKRPVPAALQPERWWWPLAAAATIGAIAVGLLQLAAQENSGPYGGEKAVVSDMPAAVPPAIGPSPEGRDPPAKPAAALPPAADSQAPSPSRADAPSKPAPRKDPPPAAAEARPAARPPSPETGSVPAKPAAESAGMVRADTAALAEPFPAGAAKREAKVPAAVIPAAAPAPAADAGNASALTSAKEAGGRLEPSPGTQRDAMPIARAPAERSDASDVRRQQAASASSPATGGAGAAMAQPGAPAPSAARTVGPGGTAGKSDASSGLAPSVARAGEPVELPVPDWIALIRKLRDAGNTAEAVRELAAFRSAHPDHARLLPPDLRDWRPPGR